MFSADEIARLRTALNDSLTENVRIVNDECRCSSCCARIRLEALADCMRDADLQRAAERRGMGA